MERIKSNKYGYKEYSCFPLSNNLNINIPDELLRLSDGVCAYNYSFDKGILSDGLGINNNPLRIVPDNIQDKYLFVPPDNEEFDSLFLYNEWDGSSIHANMFIIAYMKSGNFYYKYLHADNVNFKLIPNINFSQRPIVTQCKINNRDVALFVSKSDGMYIWSVVYDEAQKIDNSEKISSMCYIYDRLFITTFNDRDKVFYSSDVSPVDFSSTSEGVGVIEFDDISGMASKLLSFNGYLYVFRDFNIAKITYNNEKELFKVNQIFVGNSYIYNKTISVCGTKIIYLTLDGLYEFDGTKSKKILSGLDFMFKNMANDDALGGYADGYYYLACKLNFNDNKKIGSENRVISKNNALLKIDVNDYTFSILRGVQVESMSEYHDIYDSTIFVTYLDSTSNISKFGNVDMSGMLNGNATNKIWKSPNFDFGSNNYKIIKDLTIMTASDCKLIIEYDGKNKVISLKGSNRYQKIPLYLKCKKISVAIESVDSGVKIVGPTFSVGMVE
ncbi:MAG: hypothetical protein E7345_00875 [Clostridiales bacterium]|nr:hypothetical protein [Clostridiales bacterium]